MTPEMRRAKLVKLCEIEGYEDELFAAAISDSAPPTRRGVSFGILGGMLTDADLARIVAVVATKEDISRIEERLAALEENFNRFVTACEKFTGAFQDLKLEYAAVSTQLSRHEEWIKTLAEKAGVTLEH